MVWKWFGNGLVISGKTKLRLEALPARAAPARAPAKAKAECSEAPPARAAPKTTEAPPANDPMSDVEEGGEDVSTWPVLKLMCIYIYVCM
jgi:hypothetical protein